MPLPRYVLICRSICLRFTPPHPTHLASSTTHVHHRPVPISHPLITATFISLPSLRPVAPPRCLSRNDNTRTSALSLLSPSSHPHSPFSLLPIFLLFFLPSQPIVEASLSPIPLVPRPTWTARIDTGVGLAAPWTPSFTLSYNG